MFQLSIISGFRSREEQDQLRREGRPAADEMASTHRTCPATGADLYLGLQATNTLKAQFGAAVRLVGLRWGGGSPIDPGTGIPSDWNHVDLGAR